MFDKEKAREEVLKRFPNLCYEYKKPDRYYRKQEISGRDRTRELVRIRDNHTCQKCGEKWLEGNRRFDIHHLNGLCGKRSRKYDKVSEIDGLITYCHKCHLGLESVRNKMMKSQKNYKEIRKRNNEIFKLRKEGKKAREIGATFGITSQRVFQILSYQQFT